MSKRMQQVYPDEEAQMRKDNEQDQGDANVTTNQIEDIKEYVTLLERQLAEAREAFENIKEMAEDGNSRVRIRALEWLTANPEVNDG